MGSEQLWKDGAEAVRCLKRSPPREQLWSTQGAGKWQRYLIHAMAGACRAERAKWGLTRGVGVYIGVEPEPRMEILVECLKPELPTPEGAFHVAGVLTLDHDRRQV